MTEIVLASAFVSALVSMIVVSALRRRIPRGHAPLLLDPDGHTRVEMTADRRGEEPQGIVGLRFFTPKGRLSGGIGAFKDEGTLAFLDEAELPRVSVRIEDSFPRLIFFTPSDSRRGIGYRSIVLGLRPTEHTLWTSWMRQAR